MSFGRQVSPWLLLGCSLLLGACAQQPSLVPSPPPDSSDRVRRESVDRHRQLALRYRESGDLVSAAAQWQILTLLAPQEEGFRNELAATRAAIARAVGTNLQAGTAALRRGDSEEASLAMLRVLVLAPDNAEAAHALRQIEQQKAARIQAERVARLTPETGAVASRPGRASARTNEAVRTLDLDQPVELFNAGDIAGGLTEMHRYVEANPRDSAGRQQMAGAVYQRAHLLDSQGAKEQALTLYEQAIALRGDRPSEWDSRINALRKVLADEYYDKGVRAYRTDVALAIKHWEASLRYDPKHVNSALRLQEARRLQDNLKRIEQQQKSRQ